MRLVVVYLLPVFLLLAPNLFSQQFGIKQFAVNDGLPDPFVYHSFQDKSGFLWSATTKGLTRFDGQFFKTYTISTDGSDFIYTGLCDDKGQIWLGSFGGKIYTYDSANDKLVPRRDSITGSVNRIVLSRDKQTLFFISKGSGIGVLKSGRMHYVPFADIYQVNGVGELASGKLLLSSPEGLYMFDGQQEKFSKLSGWDGDAGELANEKENIFLFSVAGKGMLRASISESTASLRVLPFEHEKLLSGKDIASFFFDASKNFLYLSLRDESFCIVDLRKASCISFTSEKLSGLINSLSKDSVGNVWASTAGKGLYRISERSFSFIDMGGQSIAAITGDASGNMYYGTKSGIVVINSQSAASKTLSLGGGIKIQDVTALYFDGSSVWAGTSGSGLFVIDTPTMNGKQVSFSQGKYLTINSITGNSARQEVYVNTDQEGVYIFKSGSLLRHFSVENSLLHNNVFFSIGIGKKIYYATHQTGINFSEDDQVYEVRIKDPGLLSDFNCFAANSQNQLAVGTNGDGIYFINDSVITPLEASRHLESKYCNSLLYDKHNNLWVALRYSLYKYYPGKNVFKKIEIGNEEGRLFNSNSFYISSTGALYFGTTKDVVAVSENNMEAAVPKPYITGLIVDDSIKSTDTPLELENGKHNFTFRFSALCLANSENIHFRYMLAGRDSKWSELSATREANFEQVDEGEYTFRVMAYNSDGESLTEAASFSFIIKKPIWKTYWFWILCAMILVLLVYLILRIRTASLLKAKERLEKIVDEKTHELRMEKELVESKNVVIEEQNHEIQSSIRYAKNIQEAILPKLDKPNTHGDHILIYFRPRDIVSGDFYWVAEKEGRLIVAACDCTGHGVPGAFMSLIGSTILDKIVFDRNIKDPATIMSQMDEGVSESLKQQENEMRDGMEAGLCSIDFSTGEILYTGAKRPLFLYRKTENGFVLEEYKPDKYSVGGYTEAGEKIFNTQTINAVTGDMLYMFSDGIIDQFDAENKKRISTKRLRELLATLAGLPISVQKERIHDFIESWKKDTHQTDDILILGVRL